MHYRMHNMILKRAGEQVFLIKWPVSIYAFHRKSYQIFVCFSRAIGIIAKKELPSPSVSLVNQNSVLLQPRKSLALSIPTAFITRTTSQVIVGTSSL